MDTRSIPYLASDVTFHGNWAKMEAFIDHVIDSYPTNTYAYYTILNSLIFHIVGR